MSWRLCDRHFPIEKVSKWSSSGIVACRQASPFECRLFSYSLYSWYLSCRSLLMILVRILPPTTIDVSETEIKKEKDVCNVTRVLIEDKMLLL